MVSLSSQTANKSEEVGGGGQNDSFHIYQDPAAKPDLVPTSCFYCDIDNCTMNVCGKSHQD